MKTASKVNGRAYHPETATDNHLSIELNDAFPAPAKEAAFYGVAGEIVRALEPQTEADPHALLIHLLTEVGSIVGRKVYATAGGERHHCNLFTALVGNTSKGRKGTASAAARHVTQQVDVEWRESRVLPGLSSGEGLKWAVRDAIFKDEPVKEKGKKTGEVESIRVDPGVEDKRLLAIEGEFASVLQVMSREKNTLSATLRQAWDGHRLCALTKNDPVTATDPHISVIGHITREELRQLLTDTDSTNGFGNRFLWLAVRRSKSLPEGGNLAEANIQESVVWLRQVRMEADKLGELRRTEEARELWANVYPNLSEAKTGLLGSMTSRAEAQVLRLSVLYALLDGAKRVEVVHLEAALALWDYCERSARWIFGITTGSRDADEIRAALRTAGSRGLSATEISVGVFNRHRDSAQIGQALKRLLGSDMVVCRENRQTGGAPSQRWYASEHAPAPLLPTNPAK